MDAHARPGSGMIDAHGKTTREVNEAIRAALADGRSELEVANPGSRHNLAAGILEPARITFSGDVGYFCGGLSDGLDIHVEGNAGWSAGADMMDGRIVVDGIAGSSTGASMRGGLVVVKGNAGARSAIAGKGGTVLIGGSTGYMSGFMNQRTRLVVCGDAGEAFGDSMYEGELFCGGDIAGLGSDTVEEEPTDEDTAWLARLCAEHGLGPRRTWRKVRSAGRLWRYDKKEFSVWKEAL
jgi:methylamine---glutamate N-methyltransferase subunit B